MANNLALFVHHHLHKFSHKFRRSREEAVLTQALKLDFHVLCPSLQLQFPDLDKQLVRDELHKILATPDLSAAPDTP